MTPPSDHKQGDHHPVPFAVDEILFTVNADNVDQYKSSLSEGQKYLIANQPSYFLNVYPTQRTAAYPQRIYDAALRNAGKARATLDGMAIG